MKKHKLLFLVFAFAGKLLLAQSSDQIRKYIDTYKSIAVAEEIRTGVPAAITLAQGIHETGAGTSDLVLSSNNHFGIKCKTEWNGAAVYHDDDAKGECFRKYNDPMDSYRDHSDFLKNRPYYASLFKLDPTDYKSWAFGLKKAGYATNPKYPQILIKLIEEYKLQDYTLLALDGKMPGNDAVFASNPVKSDADEIKPVNEPEAPVVKLNYPSGVFKINETKVVLVTKGTSFLMVAQENNVSLPRLFEFNDMKPADIADRDQLIYLQRKRKSGANEFHEVRGGESVYDVAQAEGLRMESLMEYNFLEPGMQPVKGEKLYLQSKAPSMPKLADTDASRPAQNELSDAMQRPVPVNNESETIMHTVQPKETVYAIAKKYSVAVNDVMKWNEMETNDLKTGQQIRINKKRTDASN